MASEAVCLPRLFIIAVLGLSGCAFGDREAFLSYPPKPTSDGSVVSAAQAAPVAPSHGKPIIVLRFDDLRTDKRTVGEVRNGWGMKTANVIVKNDVAEWATQAATVELQKAGYQVSSSDSPTKPPNAPVLKAEILTVYCIALFAYEGEVSFVAKVQRDGREILSKRYTGTGSAGFNMAATGESYSQSLSLALGNAIGNLVTDIKQLGL